MDSKLRSFDLEQIDKTDHFYRIADRKDLTNLVRSIEQYGVLNPPILIRKDTNWVVVSGFARIEALRLTGALSFSARELADSTPLRDCICLAISEKSTHGQLSLTEQSRAVGLLSKITEDPGQIAKLARSAGLSFGKDLCEKLLLVSKMPDQLRACLSKGEIALPTAIRLSGLRDDDAGRSLTYLLGQLNLSLNRQREMIDWIEAIAKRERLGIPDVVHNEKVQSILLDPEADLKQKASQIRLFLKRWRYPTITAAEKRFMDNCKELHLPKNAQLIPPPGFESMDYTLKVTFDSTQSLQSFHDELKDVISSPALKSLFDTIE